MRPTDSRLDVPGAFALYSKAVNKKRVKSFDANRNYRKNAFNGKEYSAAKRKMWNCPVIPRMIILLTSLQYPLDRYGKIVLRWKSYPSDQPTASLY